ncbi:MAG: acyltransferase family protein [Blautia sp.]|nr:acyltransferase family protein [Blautia sp.]
MKERVALWDNLKFLMITLVVIGHFIDCLTKYSDFYKGLFLFIYAFHMPVFLFISGMFHSNKNIKQRILFFLSVGFLQKIVFAMLYAFLLQEELEFSLLSDAGIPWFMFVLAIYTVLLYLLRNQNKMYILAAAIVLSCFAGLDQSVGDFLYLSRTIVFFPFYLAGDMVKSEDVIAVKEKYKWLPLVSLAVLVLWGLVCYSRLEEIYPLRYLFTGRHPFPEQFLQIGPAARLVCYFISSLTGAAFVFLVPNRRIPLVSDMGTHSIDVYFWHWGIILLLEKFLHVSDLFQKGVAGNLEFIGIAIAVTIVLSLAGIFRFPLKQMKDCCYYKPVNNKNKK